MTRTYLLEDLDCANCAAKIENAIKELDGVNSASVSFMTQKLVVDIAKGRESEVEKAAKKLIKKVDSDVTLKAIG